MQNTTRLPILAALVLGLLSFGALPVAAGASANIELTVRVGQTEEGEPTQLTTYTFVLVSGESHASFNNGVRMPIPISVGEPGLTSYSYQNIGFSLTGRAELLDDGRIEVNLNLENSSVVRPGKVPVIASSNASANALLISGKPLQLTHIEGSAGNPAYFEIEARALK